jgi:ribonuclease P/MRP protein subunit POP5
MKNKPKTLLPTLRGKRRYIKFQIISEEPITYPEVEQAIWNTMLDFFGEYETSKANLRIIKNLYDEKKQIGIIRCDNKSVPQVIACMGLISRLGDTRIIFKILKVSGTIKKLR